MKHDIDKLIAKLTAARDTMREHQAAMLDIALKILAGEYPKDAEGKSSIVASVTPGGGKTLMSAILYNVMIAAGLIDAVLILVPRNSLKNQFATGSTKPEWGLTARVIPTDGKRITQTSIKANDEVIAGSVMTIQACLLNWKSILKSFKGRRVLVIIDEFHHLADPIDDTELDEDARVEQMQKWLKAIEPLYNTAAYRLCMSGTLRRSEAGKKVPFVEYDEDRIAKVDIKYTRRMALAAIPPAIIPITAFCANGRAQWEEYTGKTHNVELNEAKTEAHVRRSRRILCNDRDYTWKLVLQAIEHWTWYRNATGYESRMIIVCNRQNMASAIAKRLRQEKSLSVALATSDNPTGQGELARFRDSGMCHILVTVDMACEGLDVPDCTHMVCLSTKRTRVWLEQTLARIVRPNRSCSLPIESQEAFVFVPDDPPMARFLDSILEEQGETYTEKEKRVSRGGAGAKPWLGFTVIDTDKLEDTVRDVGEGVVSEEELAVIARACERFPFLKAVPLTEKRKLVRLMDLDKDQAAE